MLHRVNIFNNTSTDRAYLASCFMPVWISPLVIISQKPKTMIKLCTAFGEYMHIHSTSTHAQSSTRPLFTDMPQNSKAWSLTMRSPAGRLCRSGRRVSIITSRQLLGVCAGLAGRCFSIESAVWECEVGCYAVKFWCSRKYNYNGINIVEI